MVSSGLIVFFMTRDFYLTLTGHKTELKLTRGLRFFAPLSPRAFVPSLRLKVEKIHAYHVDQREKLKGLDVEHLT